MLTEAWCVAGAGSSVPGAEDTHDATLDAAADPHLPLLANSAPLSHTKENTVRGAPAGPAPTPRVLHSAGRARQHLHLQRQRPLLAPGRRCLTEQELRTTFAGVDLAVVVQVAGGSGGGGGGVAAAPRQAV